ncbi:hypothetical protein BH11GEM1_BH11GEM1_36400 [soil metagenome]
MRQHTMRQFTLACLAVALLAWLGTLVIPAFDWLGVPTSSMSDAATAIMIVTLALQLAFILTQMLPEGRSLIRIRYLGPDAWFAILSMTLLPGVLWHYLRGMAAPFMHGIMPGFATPLLNAVLFMIGRLIQQRNYRHLVDGSAPPTT